MTAAENLARWREAVTRHAEDRAVFYDDPDPIAGPFIAHRTEFCDRRHSMRESCNTSLREAMPALLGFAEALTSAHQPYEEHGYRWCRCCRFSWPCPIASLAEQHLGGGS